jgi:putative transposase
MDERQSLSHTRWDRKYHVVFIPKCRRKALYQELRRHLGPVFRQLAKQKESEIEAGHVMIDHVHTMISIPPKYAVSQVVGFIKGKSAIHLARVYGERKGNFVGQHFWARGYFVSTVGRDVEVIRQYIRNQEKEDQRLEQLNLWRWATFRWHKTSGPRQRPHPAASSGPNPKAPGFAGGYLPEQLVRLYDKIHGGGTMATIKGTSKRNILNGTAGNDLILGLAGNDDLCDTGGNTLRWRRCGYLLNEPSSEWQLTAGFRTHSPPASYLVAHSAG